MSNDDGSSGLRVAIVTPVGLFNYGNRLQNYASCRVWEKTGFHPTTYSYSPISRRAQIKRLLKRALGRSYYAGPPVRASSTRLDRFKSFNEQHLEMEAFEGKIPRGFEHSGDLFSAGSDQVWNPFFAKDLKWRFLEFAPREKRVALCPSIGVPEIPEEKRREYKRGLMGFPELSVREEEGAKVIRDLTGREAVVLSDPTLILRAEEWRAIASAELTPQEPYVMAYLLGEGSAQRDALLEQLGNGLKVIVISDNDPEGRELPAGPAEFIDLVDNAALVVTDSFHACVFSTLLETPLVAVPRAGGEHMSGRIDTLAAKLDLARVPVPDAPYPAERLVPGPDLDARLAAERFKFAGYLHGVLESRGFHEQAELAWAACNAAPPSEGPDA